MTRCLSRVSLAGVFAALLPLAVAAQGEPAAASAAAPAAAVPASNAMVSPAAAAAPAASAAGAAPAPSVPPAAAAETPPPHTLIELDSKALGERRRIVVYTPPGYADAPARRYPVLYMPDGGLQEDFPHVAGAVDRAIRAGRMRALIIVGIENTERRRDLTGPTAVAEDRKIAPRVGGSTAFRAFLRDELLPQIAARYRVDAERAIIGESLAGLFVLETCTLEPQLFDTCIALSPSLWWNGGALVRAIAGLLRARPQWQARWYIASAGDDILAPIAELARVLGASAPQSLRWQYEPRPDLRHATIYRGLAPELLPRLFAP